MAGQRDELFLELAHTAIAHVTDDKHASLSLTLALNGLTGGLEPTTGAVRTRDREVLRESLTARCSLAGIRFRRNHLPRAIVEGGQVVAEHVLERGVGQHNVAIRVDYQNCVGHAPEDRRESLALLAKTGKQRFAFTCLVLQLERARLEVFIGRVQLFDGGLELLVECLELLVGSLLLFVEGLDLLHRRLGFLVADQKLLVCATHLGVARRQLLVGLQELAHRARGFVQQALQPLGPGVGLVKARVALASIVLALGDIGDEQHDEIIPLGGVTTRALDECRKVQITHLARRVG